MNADLRLEIERLIDGELVKVENHHNHYEHEKHHRYSLKRRVVIKSPRLTKSISEHIQAHLEKLDGMKTI